jgi:hypothetical protein
VIALDLGTIIMIQRVRFLDLGIRFISPGSRTPTSRRPPWPCAAAPTCLPSLPCTWTKGGEAVAEQEGRGRRDEESSQRISVGRGERISVGRVTEW